MGILLLIALASFGMTLIDRGLYVDGWYLDRWQRERAWPTVRRFYKEVGLPYLYVFHRTIGFLPGYTSKYRVITFVSLYGTSCVIYLLILQTGLFPDMAALLVAAVYLSYPGNKMMIEKTVSQYAVLPFAFYLAALLATWEISDRTNMSWVQLWLAMALFLISFNMHSLLVYYFAFVAYQAILLNDFTWSGLGGIQEYLLSYGYFIVLPFVFWLLKQFITPKSEAYRSYNSIKLRNVRPKMLAALTLEAFSVGLFGSLLRGLSYPNGRGYKFGIVVIAFSLTCALTIGALTEPENPFLAAAANYSTLAAFGLGAAFAAAFPYIISGNRFASRGWGTKNSALLGLPYALLVVGLAGWLMQPGAAYVSVVFLTVAGACILTRSHLFWISTYLKWISVRENVRQLRDKGALPADACLMVVRDNAHVDWYSDGSRMMPPVVLTSALASPARTITCLAILDPEVASGRDNALPHRHGDEVQCLIEQTTVPYWLNDIHRDGSQHLLTVEIQGLPLSPARVCGHLMARWLPRTKRGPQSIGSCTRSSLVAIS